jgi:hypothetical protein
MSKTQFELDKWRKAEYPYDNAECGICATSHEYCYSPEHAEMKQEARKLGLFNDTQHLWFDEMKQEAKKLGLFNTQYLWFDEMMRQVVEELGLDHDVERFRDKVLAFREKFAEFYKEGK